MKYKIYKKVKRTHVLNDATGLYELIETDQYYIKRKGTIFGFMHDVGDFVWDFGGGFIALKFFDSIEKAESYLYCWNKENYGNEPIEIIKEIKYNE